MEAWKRARQEAGWMKTRSRDARATINPNADSQDGHLRLIAFIRAFCPSYSSNCGRLQGRRQRSAVRREAHIAVVVMLSKFLELHRDLPSGTKKIKFVQKTIAFEESPGKVAPLSREAG